MTYVRRAPLVMKVLDLWAKGYTAAIIADRVPGCPRKAVDVIVAQARSIGDPRAVLHCYPRKKGQPTRLVGNARHGQRVMLATPHIKIVPLRKPYLPQKVTHDRSGLELRAADQRSLPDRTLGDRGVPAAFPGAAG